MGSNYLSFALKVPATPSFPENNIPQKKYCTVCSYNLDSITNLDSVLSCDVSGLKDTECCSLAYVDPNRTELGNDDVLPFPVSKSFPPPCALNLTAEKWKMIPKRGL